MKENERKWKKMIEKWTNMKENERTGKNMKEHERKWKIEKKEKWKKKWKKWKYEKKWKNEKNEKMKKNEKWKKWKKWEKRKKWKNMKNEKNEKMKKKWRKMMKKERKIKKKMDSHAKSSTISRIYRCCCNFFRRNPRRFPWFCFGMCLFPEENQQPVLEGNRFSEEKWQFSLDVKQKHTFYRRKSTKKKNR